MLRFPVYRKCLRTYAAAIPVLYFAAVMCLLAWQLLLAATLVMLAWYLHTAVPGPAAAQLKGAEGTGILGHLESLVLCGLLLWLLIWKDNTMALIPDWQVIVIAVILTGLSIVRRWRRTERLSDADLFVFYSAGK